MALFLFFYTDYRHQQAVRDGGEENVRQTEQKRRKKPRNGNGKNTLNKTRILNYY